MLLRKFIKCLKIFCLLFFTLLLSGCKEDMSSSAQEGQSIHSAIYKRYRFKDFLAGSAESLSSDSLDVVISIKEDSLFQYEFTRKDVDNKHGFLFNPRNKELIVSSDFSEFSKAEFFDSCAIRLNNEILELYLYIEDPGCCDAFRAYYFSAKYGLILVRSISWSKGYVLTQWDNVDIENEIKKYLSENDSSCFERLPPIPKVTGEIIVPEEEPLDPELIKELGLE